MWPYYVMGVMDHCRVAIWAQSPIFKQTIIINFFHFSSKIAQRQLPFAIGNDFAKYICPLIIIYSKDHTDIVQHFSDTILTIQDILH